MAVQKLGSPAGGGSIDTPPACWAPSREASKTTTMVVAAQVLSRSSSASSIRSTKGKNEEERFFSTSSGSSELIPYETVHQAARQGDANYVAAQLNDGGLDPNALLNDRLPLLYAAIEGDHQYVLSTILSHNPDINATFQLREDLPPLDPCAYAIFSGAIDSFDLLLEQAHEPPQWKLGRIGSWLHLAVRFMQYEMISHLRTAHHQLFAEMMKCKDHTKLTPQRLAVELGDREALVTLLGEKWGRKIDLSYEAPTRFTPSVVELNAGVGAGAMGFVGAIQVLEEQNCMQGIEAFLGSSAAVIVAALAALGRTSQEMQYWISQCPLDQMLDERPNTHADIELPDFRPSDAKVRPTELLETLNAHPPICKGLVLKSFIEFMVGRVTQEEHFTLKQLSNQTGRNRNRHHLIVPIRNEDGVIKFIRSDREEYANVELTSLMLAAMATPGLYRRVNILEIKSGEPSVFLPNCSDPALTRFKSTNFTCLDDAGLPYFKRGLLSFSLCSSAPLPPRPGNDAPVEERALYIVSLHHIVRRLLTLPDTSKRLDQVIIDTRGHGISEEPILFVNAGRDPTQKHFRSCKRSLPPLSFTPLQRKALSQAIEERVLFGEKGDSFQNSRRMTILQSPSGLGKSTLVHMVLSNHRDHFSDLFAVDYDTPSTTLASLVAIASSLELFVEPYEDIPMIEQKIKRLLEEHCSSKPWLLVCENCRDLPRELLPQFGGSIICCLTRDPVEYQEDNAFIIPPLTSSQALELLKNETQAIRALGDLAKVAERLDNNAQALMQASRLIKEHAIPPGTYLELLGERSSDIDPTSETLGIALSYLRERSSYSACCVEIFAHMAPDAIPESWVKRWLAGFDDDERKPTSFDILTRLERCGFITYHPNRQEFSIHRKTRIAIQQQTAQDNSTSHIDLIVRLREDFQTKDPSTWQNGRIWAVHAQFLIDGVQNCSIDMAIKGAIYQTLGEVHLCTGQAKLAVRAFQMARDAFSEDMAHAQVRVYSLLGLGSAALERHDLALAERSFSEGLALVEDDTALEPSCSLLCGLGDTYFIQGNYQAARQTYGEVVKKNQVSPLLERSLAYPRAELGRAEAYLTIDEEGALSSAAQILEETEHLFIHRYGEDPHPDVARRYSLLARIHREQQELDLAHADANKALTIYKTLYPRETHPQVALAYGNLATLYLDRGLPKKALKKNSKALGILNHIYPDIYHPIKIVLLDGQARILKQLGKYRKACNTLSEQAGLLVQHNPGVMLGCNVQSEAEKLYSEGSYKRALPFYRAVASIYIHYDPSDPATTLNRAAKEAFDEKSHLASIVLRENALVIDRQRKNPPTDFTALLHARIGLAYTHLKKYAEAYTHLDNAIKIYGDLYPYAAEIAGSPWSLAQHSNIQPIEKVGHLLATVKLYKESAAIYRMYHLNEEVAINHPLYFSPPLTALAEDYYDRNEYSSSAHHWQSLISYLLNHDGDRAETAYAYYRLAQCQQKDSQKVAAEESAAIAQSLWEKLLGQIPDPTPLELGEKRVNLLINIGKTQYIRWKYRDAAASFQEADGILEQLIEQNYDPSRNDEWTQQRAFLEKKIRINSSPLKRPFDYS